jgi:serine phosphatase RsbU (regulator of sigma subunit)
VKFIDTLKLPPCVAVDPAQIRPILLSLRQHFPETAAALLRPGPAGSQHTLLAHSHAQPGVPHAGQTLALDVAEIERALGEQHAALLHAPFHKGLELTPLFPDCSSVFLRRMYATDGQPLVLAFAVEGLDAEFAGRHGAKVLTERLLHRLDDFILRNQVEVATRRLQQQLDEVKTVKEKLLPGPDHRVDGARFAVHYAPGPGGGGDYYEVVDLRLERTRVSGVTGADYWGVIIGDVSGHGPGAAVEVAMLDSILRTFRADTEYHPGAVLTYCNRYMFTRQVRGGFMTLFLANYDGASQRLQYASAGHPGAFVRHADRGLGTTMLDAAVDIPLVVEQEHSWRSESVPFGEQDMLVLYTDGITEAESPAGDPFGIAGLHRAVDSSTAADPRALLADIVAALDRHCNGVPITDDCTIVIVQPAPN